MPADHVERFSKQFRYPRSREACHHSCGWQMADLQEVKDFTQWFSCRWWLFVTPKCLHREGIPPIVLRFVGHPSSLRNGSYFRGRVQNQQFTEVLWFLKAIAVGNTCLRPCPKNWSGRGLGYSILMWINFCISWMKRTKFKILIMKFHSGLWVQSIAPSRMRNWLKWYP